MTSPSAKYKSLIFAALLVVAGCGEISSRADFEALVKDQSTSEVQKKVGKPAAIEESGAGTVHWTYNSKTFTTHNGPAQFDKKTIIVFRKSGADGSGKVKEVVYE